MKPSAVDAALSIALETGRISTEEVPRWQRLLEDSDGSDHSILVDLISRPEDRKQAQRNFEASPVAKTHEAEMAARLGVKPENLI